MKIQLKRSNVLELGSAKEPTSAQMEYGELAVNYNNGDPAIFLKDSNDKIIRIAGVGNINAGDNPSGDVLPPTGNNVGDIFFNTSNNTLYYWDGTVWVPIANDVTAADIFVGTLAEIDVDVPAATRRNGFLWWNTEDGTLYIWYIDPNTSQFVIAIPSSGGGSGASVVVNNLPPTGPNQGDMWWNTTDGRLYIWYQDVDTGQWVDASPDSQVNPITSGEGFPPTGSENDMFFNTTDGRLYIYYNDGLSLQWVDASPDSQGAIYWDRTGTTLSPSNAGDNVQIENIQLNANGTANFNAVSSGSNDDIFIVSATQGVTYQGQVSYTSNADLIGYAVDFSGQSPIPEKWKLSRDGSATFDSTVTTSRIISNSSGLNNIFSGDVFISATGSSSNAAITLKNDGSANFAGGNISLRADGSSYFYGELTFITENRGGFSFVTNSVGGNNSYNVGQSSTSAAFYLVQAGNGLGVYLPQNATSWVPVSSDEDVKDIIPMTVDNSWDVIRDIELFNYFYKVNDEQHRATHPPYFGPMAKRLGDQDPDLLIDNDDACTYNAGLLEMKALSALSTALNRIEALEAEVQALKGGN